MKIYWFRILLFGFCIAACTKPSKPIDFRNVSELRAGVTTKNTLLSQFGAPLAKLRDEDDEGESWQYGDVRFPRLSVFIASQSDVIHSFAFFPDDKDKESDLKTALSLYPSAKWNIEPPEWINPHSIPNECFFEDNAIGVSVAYDRAFQKVQSIRRWNPARVVTSKNHHEPPPKACIADHCVNFMSREEFKKSDWKLCEVPK